MDLQQLLNQATAAAGGTPAPVEPSIMDQIRPYAPYLTLAAVAVILFYIGGYHK